MNNKLKYRISKILILATVVTFSFVTTNVNGIINANELPTNVNESVSENDMMNRNLNQGRASNSGRFDIRNFTISGADRNNGSNTNFTINNNVHYIGDIFQVGHQSQPHGNRQTRMATSKPLNLGRSFEFIASFNMKRYPHHGFFFALHNNSNYQVRNTGGSLGIYQDDGIGESVNPGLANAFVMEIDGFKDNAYGDNMNGITREHMEVLETGSNGKYGYMNNTGPWGTRKKAVDILGNEMFSSDNPAVERVYVRFMWKPKDYVGDQGLYTIEFGQFDKNKNQFTADPNLRKFNSYEQESSVLNSLYKNGGQAVLSLGGSVEYRSGQPMEIGLHRLKYNDLDPGMWTDFYDETGNIKIDTVYPGQTITVQHRLFNKYNIKYNVRDNLRLFYVYLQFLTQDGISGSIGANNNIDVFDVKSGLSLSNLRDAGRFDGENSLKIEFPSQAGYFYVRYKMVVPSRFDDNKFYNQPTYLHIHSEIGEEGHTAETVIKNEELKLRPKIVSTRATSNTEVIDNYEVYKYNGNISNGISKSQLMQELWNNIEIHSLSGTSTPGFEGTNLNNQRDPILEKTYYYNGKLENSNNRIPELILKGDTISVAIKITDRVNSNFVDYFYRTIVVADAFGRNHFVNQDGNKQNGRHIAYGNHLGMKSETKYSTLTSKEFAEIFKSESAIKGISRYRDNDIYNAFIQNTPIVEPSVDIITDNDKIDVESEENFTPKTYQQIIKTAYQTNPNDREVIDFNSEFKLNFTVTANTSSIDNGTNAIDGQTGYIVIPSNIELVDNSSNGKAVGSGKVFAAGYDTRKKYHVWAQPTVMLTSPEMSGTSIAVKTEAVGPTGNNPSPNNSLIYLGSIDNTNSQKKQLNLRLVADSSRYKDVKFSGSLVFTFAKYR